MQVLITQALQESDPAWNATAFCGKYSTGLYLSNLKCRDPKNIYIENIKW